MLVVWKLDRLGRNLAHLVNTVQVPVGPRGGPAGARRRRGADRHDNRGRARLVFGIFAALAGFERELIRERTVAGAQGRTGPRTQGREEVRAIESPAQAALAHRDTSVSALCRELGIRPVPLYRYVGLQGVTCASRARRSSHPEAGGP